MQSLNKRLNWDIPKELAPKIRLLADMDGTTPAYLLRKILEQAVNERLGKSA
ncbi:hypothetical protein AB0758_44705 [Tolypothrix bouteillei VB521301_2]|uniref:hypothetical protein n=1 Tax=Tolypothrix bouteillei TaxID=1246981 RepID=UPI000A81CFB3